MSTNLGEITLNGNVTANSETVTPSQVGYLNDVTSDIQAQLDAKVSNPLVGSFKAQTLESEHTVPTMTMHNTTEDNMDGGRNSQLICRGEKADGTEHTLAIIEGAHDGTLDDTKGYVRILTNSGTAPTEAMRIDSSGKVGIGTDSPSQMLQLQDSSDTGMQITKEGALATRVQATSNGLKFGCDLANGDTERMRIDTNGYVYMFDLNTISGQSDVQYNTTTSELGYVSSSKRYKENIKKAEISDTEFIYDFDVKVYDHLLTGRKKEVGLIAEDVEKINKDIIGKKVKRKPQIDQKGNVIDYGDSTLVTETYSRSELIIPILHQLQEQNKKIKEQESTINDLISRIESLEAKNV